MTSVTVILKNLTNKKQPKQTTTKKWLVGRVPDNGLQFQDIEAGLMLIFLRSSSMHSECWHVLSTKETAKEVSLLAAVVDSCSVVELDPGLKRPLSLFSFRHPT